MRIAIYASIEHQVPPPSGRILAPWALTAQLADGLVDLGHDVTLYTVAESRSKAKILNYGLSLADCVDNKGQKDRDRVGFLDYALLSQLYADAAQGQYDIVHIHHPLAKAIHFIRFATVPTVVTVHDMLDKPYYFDQYRNIQQLHIAPISQSQSSAIPGLPYTPVVYNGIDTSLFSFNPNPGKYLFAASRIARTKGFHHAIKVAQKTGIPLIIAGEVYHKDPVMEAYWKEIEPQIDGELIKFVGAITQQELAAYYRDALALLFPIEWAEPFGLVMIEAMASGTPVIAFDKGSVSEVVVNNKTGFIVENENQMVEAVGKITQINRQDCRQHVENNFSLKQMIKGYEQVYAQLKGL
jgi:glycosyltransferase involved in cell wall biosynthesis